MGSKGSQSQQNAVQNYQANPTITGAGTQAVNMAETAASAPFQQPVQPIAGFSSAQQQAFNQYENLQGIQTPFYNAAQNLYTQAGQTPNVASFYNPMAANVTAQMENIFGQQDVQNNASLVNAAGGVGADRIAVGQGNLANQQGLAAGQTYANLWQQAQTAAQAQQQAEMAAGSGMAQLGGQSLQSGLQGTAALFGAGQAQQTQQQQQLNAIYQNQLAQIAYPFQTAQYLSGITGGLAGAFGGTTYGTQNATPAYPSGLSQALGIGTAGIGAYGALNNGFGGNSINGSILGGEAPSNAAISGMTDAQANQYEQMFGNRGGGVPFAGGGEVQEPNWPGSGGGNSVVPYIPMSNTGHAGPATGSIFSNQNQNQNQNSATNNTGSDISAAIGAAAKIAPFLMADGGDVEDDGRHDYSGFNQSPNVEDRRNQDRLGAYIGQGIDNGTKNLTAIYNLLTGRQGPRASYDMNNPMAQQLGIRDIGSQSMASGGTAYPHYGDDGGGGTIYTDPFGGGFTPPPAPGGSGMGPLERVTNAINSQAHAATQPPPPPQAYPANVGDVIPPDLPPPAATPPQKTAPAKGPAIPRHAKMDASDDDADTGTSGANLPYPNATAGNWGQNIAHSPWMALINAGATMAATPGPVGMAIGKGMLAGTKSLTDLATQGRSEQELNDKAQELYETAQEHKKKWNDMTPYQRQELALKNKELDQEGATPGGGDSIASRALHSRALQYYKLLKQDPANIAKTDAEILQHAYTMAGGVGVPTGGAAQPQATAGPPNPSTIANAKAAISAGAKPADIIAEAAKKGVTLTPDMLQ